MSRCIVRAIYMARNIVRFASSLAKLCNAQVLHGVDGGEVGEGGGEFSLTRSLGFSPSICQRDTHHAYRVILQAVGCGDDEWQEVVRVSYDDVRSREEARCATGVGGGGGGGVQLPSAMVNNECSGASSSSTPMRVDSPSAASLGTMTESVETAATTFEESTDDGALRASEDADVDADVDRVNGSEYGTPRGVGYGGQHHQGREGHLNDHKHATKPGPYAATHHQHLHVSLLPERRAIGRLRSYGWTASPDHHCSPSLSKHEADKTCRDHKGYTKRLWLHQLAKKAAHNSLLAIAKENSVLAAESASLKDQLVKKEQEIEDLVFLCDLQAKKLLEAHSLLEQRQQVAPSQHCEWLVAHAASLEKQVAIVEKKLMDVTLKSEAQSLQLKEIQKLQEWRDEQSLMEIVSTREMLQKVQQEIRSGLQLHRQISELFSLELFPKSPSPVQESGSSDMRLELWDNRTVH